MCVAGCSTVPVPPTAGDATTTTTAMATTAPATAADALRVLDRVTWGASASSVREVHRLGVDGFLAAQLRPGRHARLPAAVDAQIAAMTIAQQPVVARVIALELQRRQGDAGDVAKSDEEKQAARSAYRQELARLGREAMSRSLLRAMYSPNQLQEQLTWFWFNHFNVNQNKGLIRAMIGDYEDTAIRPHVLGRFRDLLQAVVRHPAMLVYLDNAQNAANRINENFARELMELHTLGADGGYTQRDVQELARVLTGVGVNLRAEAPNVRPQLQSQYVRDGLFEFNPNRHDYGDKEVLGLRLRGEGLKEVDAVLDHIARQPATARFVSRKLALYFVADDPPPALVERMAAAFMRTDGDIAAVLEVAFAAPEFAASLGGKFKDPVHYVVSAVRLAYDERPIANTGPLLNWLNRMAEPLYGRQTPDGYPLTRSAWASPGQMATRFEIAKAIGMGSAGLFRAEGAGMDEVSPTPQLSNVLYREHLAPRLAPPTRAALEQAGSPAEWNVFLLSSPEFMNR